ncbi:type II secretion system F family protein [Burkholderia ubonensis]|uniref:type II secretion system F family protein n=1 Tax=Burkholderia ubonensis TaxID=101571 RepID=UPI000BA54AE0|nr:type II secretion system F family protein [Burkholderia ubonensis]PAK11290.1 type II secretion system protein [Burkholderia ubonensis]RQP33723.1 type II secretion system F family protein [Burkholderia ubonensis]RQP35818.1 type II secretion system F family protein [Burkholderia ubonensis]RQP39934.1 type II secretion system F family protein [Burkholderia ubonensis]RQP53534.1 type II secretion system F family protein [Burkholderia ubonensis]
METFRIRMLADGRIVQQTVEGASAAEVRARLAVQGIAVLEIRRDARFGRRGRAPKFALALFLQELSTLLDAGLVLIEALEALRDKADAGKAAKHVIDRILAVMVEGQPLSKALAQQPEVFPPLLVATVESSEGSGQLPVALKRYQQYEVRIEQIRKRVMGALIYPAVVIGVGVAILLFMAFFVIPRFAVVFESLTTLPATAQAMLWWATLLRENGMVVGAAVAASFAGAVLAVRSAAVRRAAQRLMWRAPKVRDVCALFALTRFYRTVGLLIAGGTPVIAALELSGKTLPDHFRARLAAALTELRAGRPVAAVLAAHALTTSVAERLLRVGEQSGDLGGMCEHIAQFHDGALDRSIEMLSKVFEPVLMLAVGATVGAVVLLLYMPIFELAGSIG